MDGMAWGWGRPGAARDGRLARARALRARAERCRALPPPGEAEVARMVAEFRARGGAVTVCPPACAAPVQNGDGLRGAAGRPPAGATPVADAGAPPAPGESPERQPD
jgi:hypothetical protein